MTYRLLIADGQWLVRKGLRSALDAVDGNEIVGEASDVSAAVVRAIDLHPDLVLIDIRLPGGGGLVAAQKIKERRREQKVLLLGELGGGDLVRDTLRAGCDGYVRKDSGEQDLFAAIRCVRGGDLYLDAEMTRQYVLADHQREQRGELQPLDCLSPRELTVFRLVAEGHTNRGTGELMSLSPKTVEKYRASLMQKLKLRNAVELRMFAFELGVVERPSPAQAYRRVAGSTSTV